MAAYHCYHDEKKDSAEFSCFMFFKAKHTTFSGTRDLMIAPTSQTKTSLCNIHSKLKKRKESGIKTTKLSDQTVKLGISDQICINILLLDSKEVQAGPCHLRMLSTNLEHKLGAILI